MRQRYHKYYLLFVTWIVLTIVAFASDILASVDDLSHRQSSLQNPFLTEKLPISHVDPQSSVEAKRSAVDETDPQHGFGLGAFNLGTYYTTDLRFSNGGQLAAYLGSSAQQAVAFEFVGGTHQFRTNTTYGLALTEHQRIKLTYDWLIQKLNFNFYTGDVTRWVNQHAVGGDYVYLFDNAYLESIGFGGYYSHAINQHLSETIQLVPEENIKYIEQRRIAGANSMNVHTNMALHLWPHSRVTGGVNYDRVHFNTRYDRHSAAKNAHGFGGHMQIEQRLLPKLKATFLTRLQDNQREYAGSLAWLMPSPKGTQLEMQLVSDYVDSLSVRRHYYTNGLRINMMFGDTIKTYDDALDKQQTLLSWTQQPSVRMANVLAVSDSHVEKVYLEGDGNDGGDGQLGSFSDGDPVEPSVYVPDGNSIECPDNQWCTATNDGVTWRGHNAGGFGEDLKEDAEVIFESVSYSEANGAKAKYFSRLSNSINSNSVTLSNSDVEPNTSLGNWEPDGKDWFCESPAHNPLDCPFLKKS